MAKKAASKPTKKPALMKIKKPILGTKPTPGMGILRKKIKKYGGAVVCILAFCGVANAQQVDKPLLHKDRIAIGAGVGYDWYAGEQVPTPEYSREITVGLHGAYALTEHVSLSLPAVYGVDNRVYRLSPGAMFHLSAGTEYFAVGLSYDYYAGKNSQIPFYSHEWSVRAAYARPITKTILLGISEAYGVDNRSWRTSVGIRIPIFLGKDS